MQEIHSNCKFLLRDVLVIPALGKVKSKGYRVFKAIMGYKVNFRLAQSRVKTFLKTNPKISKVQFPQNKQNSESIAYLKADSESTRNSYCLNASPNLQLYSYKEIKGKKNIKWFVITSQQCSVSLISGCRRNISTEKRGEEGTKIKRSVEFQRSELVLYFHGLETQNRQHTVGRSTHPEMRCN